MIDTAHIRSLIAAGTGGRWFTGHLCDDSHSCNCPYIFSEHQNGMGAIATIGTTEEEVANIEEAKANQRSIAELHNAAVEMCDELDALRVIAEKFEWLRQCTGGQWEDLNDARFTGKFDEVLEKMMKENTDGYPQ